jgi:genome maintenance exonuclease 1
MKWNKQFIYPKSVRSIIDEERHYSVDDEKLPSVTTILAATQSDEKRASLAKWKAKVGDVEAERIKVTAGKQGTALHQYLEHYIMGQELLDLTIEGVKAKYLGDIAIQSTKDKIKEVWGLEAVLHHPIKKYAGATDMVGIYQGNDSIMDWKFSNKPKRFEYIEDYRLQICAYADAHNAVYGTKIEQGVNLIVTKDGLFQEFIINGRLFREHLDMWYKKVDQYYKMKEKGMLTNAI